ncbi:MAG TPA: hypothetical protein DFS52_26960 [Myxococcales bacterium]|nr:hypothetical protein [Myxococcales bacterium]
MSGAKSGVSRERLQQIATRKLTALGIPVQLAPDGQRLQGALSFAPGRVVNPLNNAPVTTARFSVVGHDKLQFLDPPLAALPPLEFYDLDRAAAVQDRLAVALKVRLGYLRDVAGRLQPLGLVPKADPKRLIIVAEVKTVEHTFELHGGPDGIRVGRVAPRHGTPFAVSPDSPALRLEDYPSLTDLELYLSDAFARMRPAPLAQAPAPAEQPVRLHPLPPEPEALTVSLLARFGPEALIGLDATGRLEVHQDFDLGGTRYRFTATHERGSSFHGRLASHRGERWVDRFDLARFPGIFELVAMVLEVEPTLPAAAPAATEYGAAAPLPQHLVPHPGEIWVMNVLLEREEPEEIRYVCVDVNGNPYGAARVLPRREFEAVFARHGSGWRLLIVIDQVQGQTVVYRQLDAHRQPSSAPNSLRIDNLVANFVPEASDY